MSDTTMTDGALEEYDPFEDFNRSAGIGLVDNPYPLFAMARANGPVIKEDMSDVESVIEAEAAAAGIEMTDEVADKALAAAQGIAAQLSAANDAYTEVDLSTMGDAGIPDVYTAFSFDAVQQVLRDGDVFSSKGYEDVMGAVMGHTILEMDEPEHHTYRGIVQQAFTRKTMEQWEIDAVNPIIDELIDAFVDRGSADLVRELLFPFPVNVIARLLGLPREDLPKFHRWAVELISVGFDWDRGMNASQQLGEYLGGVLAARRAEPSDDLMSLLAQAELEGMKLTDEEIFAFLRLLLPAGAETTYRSSSNLLCGLLTHTDQLDAVRNDRSLITQAIEEGLRWEPPLLTILRTATQDTVVDGVPIRAGSMIVVNMGSANHDEKYWENAEEFDIFRPARQHLAFAFGPHMCLGLHLARMETRAVLAKVFDRLPNLRLDPNAEPPLITGMTFRAPNKLQVVWG
jgi:cytochrome P450